MLTLTKSLFALMIGFILATIFGLVAIPILKKIKAGQRINIYVEAHQRKSGTPTMGGMIFIITTGSYSRALWLAWRKRFFPAGGMTAC